MSRDIPTKHTCLQALERYYKEGYGFRKKFKYVLGVRPTGWTHSSRIIALSHIKPQKRGPISIYGESS